ncbi:hypothetical protein P8452_58838 [Trifolium repens]|nr:hypothetical protein P8452_58838 [Trifolium repens]
MFGGRKIRARGFVITFIFKALLNNNKFSYKEKGSSAGTANHTSCRICHEGLFCIRGDDTSVQDFSIACLIVHHSLSFSQFL